MTIKTKFDLGDKAFVIYNNKIFEVIITSIEVFAKDATDIYTDYNIRFPSGGEVKIAESHLFNTKQELIETL